MSLGGTIGKRQPATFGLLDTVVADCRFYPQSYEQIGVSFRGPDLSGGCYFLWLAGSFGMAVQAYTSHYAPE